MNKPDYITSIKRLTELTPEEQVELAPVAAKFVFRSNSYYQQLIDWDDPEDPIRRIIVPLGGELENWGRLDASDEVSYTVWNTSTATLRCYSPTTRVAATAGSVSASVSSWKTTTRW